MIITARDFRGEQGKYFAMVASGADVVIKSRDHGSFKLVPVTDDDTLFSKEAFFAKLDLAEKEIAEGKGRSFENADEAIAYFQSL